MTTQHITNLICTYLINIGVLPAIHPGHTTLLATRIAQHHKPPTAITIAEMITMAKQALADHNRQHTPLPEAKKMQQTASVTAIDDWRNTNQKMALIQSQLAEKIHDEFDDKKPYHEINSGIMAGQHALRTGETMQDSLYHARREINTPDSIA